MGLAKDHVGLPAPLCGVSSDDRVALADVPAARDTAAAGGTSGGLAALSRAGVQEAPWARAGGGLVTTLLSEAPRWTKAWFWQRSSPGRWRNVRGIAVSPMRWANLDLSPLRQLRFPMQSAAQCYVRRPGAVYPTQ